ncbi:MAG: hypothetical protein ACRYGP_12150 [Janthinobacterium lividum]
MADVFDVNSTGQWSFVAQASRILASTQLMTAATETNVNYAEGPAMTPTHDTAYWARVSRGFDFSDADRVPVELYNQVVWKGIKTDEPYPTHRSGVDLSRSRKIDPAECRSGVTRSPRSRRPPDPRTVL